MITEWQRGDYTISTDKDRLDLQLIHNFLSTSSYWAQGRSYAIVERSIEHSLNFGVYKVERQVGFARVVTDCATFAWLADVFVVPDHRGQGLSKWLLEIITTHPDLQGLRRWVLATRDAHDLYRQFGFKEFAGAARWMERFDPNV